MLELFLIPRKVVKKLNPLDWDSASAGYVLNGNIATTTVKDKNHGVFGQLLPDEDCYYDIEIGTGYPSTAGGLGIISGDYVGSTWDFSLATQKFLGWGWSGQFTGVSTGYAPTTLNPGVYRFAYKKSLKYLYVKRMSPNASSVGVVNISKIVDLGKRLRPFGYSQAGIVGPTPMKMLATELGSGGLF